MKEIAKKITEDLPITVGDLNDAMNTIFNRMIELVNDISIKKNLMEIKNSFTKRWEF